MQAMPTSTKRRTKPEINLALNTWSAGYMSYTEAIRSIRKCFTDMTNMDLVQNGTAKIRPGTSKYGAQPLGTVIGVGTFTRVLAGETPKTYQITMQVISGVGHILYNLNGEAWIDLGGSYDPDSWATFTHLNNRVYVSNGKDEMSYVDTTTMSIISYSSIPAPTVPTVVPSSGLSGSTVTLRIRVSANNSVGETMASVATLVTVGEYRAAWDPSTQYLTMTVPQVVGATSYNWYEGTVAGEEQYLGNTVAPTSPTDLVKFVDNNRAALNPYKKAPEGNSTEGPVLTDLSASSGQLFGTGDMKDRYRFWYSGSGDNAGDFSPFNGGGWVDINYGGDSVPVKAVAFHDGKGNTATTILTRGSAGGGNLYHQTFETQTVGDYSITYPDIQPANGQTGTYSPMAVVEANNSLIYPSGTAFRTTGTKPQMINILVTNNISDTIEPDVKQLNLSAMHKAVGMELNNDVFFALPIGADHNTEIWKYSPRQNGAWVLRWTIPCDFMWKYEDTKGTTHHCLLTNNKIVEFNDSVITDDGVPFRTRLGIPTITFDDSALQMASIDMVRALLIRPQGSISVNAYGLGEDNEAVSLLATTHISPVISPAGFGTVEFDTKEFDFVLPKLSNKSKSQQTVSVEVEETLSQLDIDITTTGESSYLLNSLLVKGKRIPGLYQGDE